MKIELPSIFKIWQFSWTIVWNFMDKTGHTFGLSPGWVFGQVLGCEKIIKKR